MWTRRLLPTVAVVLLALAGCSAHVPSRGPGAGSNSRAQVLDLLQKTQPCCTRFADFDFNRPLPSRPARFVIAPGLPVADFNGTRSYFLAFRLPHHHPLPYRVLLKSEVTGRWLDRSYLFAPSVVLLDAAYRPLMLQDVQQCEYIGWSNATTGALGSVEIDNPRARYMVVYTSGEQLQGSTYWEQSPTAFSADAPVKMVATGSFSIAHGPDGPLYVGIMTPRYARAVSEAICGKRDPAPGRLSAPSSAPLPSRRGFSW